MECPICKKTGIDDSASNCPECKSELIVFQNLKKIEKHKRNRIISIATLGSLLVIVIILWIFSLTGQQETVASVPVQNNDALEQLKNENSSLASQNRALQNEVKLLKKKVADQPEKNEESYTVKAGESLFIIARKIYGNGFKYHLIAEDNQIEDPDIIQAGQVLNVYY